jgi:cysteinyl-tRNA synthetase
MEWPSPWGVGFPGWHIECSALAHEYLGQPFDIHCGGVDHIAVHHENEIAQSEAAFDVPLAHYWLHNEFLLVDGGRMGKSLGNAYTLEDVRAHGFDPIDFRYFCLGAHYRSKLNFTWDGLEAAHNAVQKLRRRVSELDRAEVEANEGVLALFQAALEDDLGTPKALALVWDLVQREDISSAVKRATLLRMDEVFGLGMQVWSMEVNEIPEDILAIKQDREEARRAKNWQASDTLRDALLARGWIVEDGVGGSSLRKA